MRKITIVGWLGIFIVSGTIYFIAKSCLENGVLTTLKEVGIVAVFMTIAAIFYKNIDN